MTAASCDALRHRLLTRDITLRACTRDKRLRICFCSTRHVLCETVRRHNLLTRTHAHVPFLQLLGTHLTFTNLLACQLDGEERVAVRLTGDEATIVSEALALGECRCYVRGERNDYATTATAATADDDSNASSLSLPFALKVDRVLYNQQRPFTSVTAAQLHERVCDDDDDDDDIASLPSIVSRARTIQLACNMHTDKDSDDAMAARVRDYFAHNATMHGVNMLRRSDGSAGAVLLLHTHLSPTRLAHAAASSRDSNDGDEATTRRQHERGAATSNAQAQLMERSVLSSCGVLVLPFAAGKEMDARLRRLQRGLVAAAAALSPSPLSSLLSPTVTAQDTDSKSTSCQDMLSLVTGDYAGARAVAALARQPLRPADEVAATVAPLRRALGLCDDNDGDSSSDTHFDLSTAPADVVRTGVDFFCRCSKSNVASALRASSAAARAEAHASNRFACTYCGAVHTFSDAEWHDMLHG